MRKSKQAIKPVDAPDYNYWQALYMAFYSSRLFVDAAKRWTGFGFMYLLILAVIGAIPLSVQMIEQFENYFNEQIIYPIEQMPLLMVQNGKVSLDKPMPYLIKNRQGDVVIAIDTQGDLKTLSDKYPQLMMLVTQDKFFFRMLNLPQFPGVDMDSIESKTYIHEFDKNDNEVFLGSDWVKNSGIFSIKYYAAILFYPMIVGALFGLFLVINLVMASIGRIIGVVFVKFHLPFKTSIRLGFVVSTAPYALVIATQSLGLFVSQFSGIYLVLVACYYFYAVLSVKRESQHVVLG